MRRIDRTGIQLLALIALPLIIAALGMTWSTSRMLDGISASVNKQEDARAWQAVQSAFDAAQERLAGVMADNANWDDAVQHSYGPIDFNWMFDTWGIGTSLMVNYDTMYIVDARGKPLISYRQGELSSISPATYFGKALQQTLQSLPKDVSTFEAVATLVETPDGLAVMAAAPILPTSEDVAVPSERANVLIFSRALTPDILAKMSKQYIVDGLKVVTGQKSDAARHVLTDKWGNPVAMASWQDRRPGNAARASYRLSALATVIGLLVVMVPISIVHLHTMSRLDRNKKDALVAARVDALTGLPNRVFLLEVLTSHLPSAKPSELALMYVDLDGFKNVNDTYDHETGDKLIRAIATGISSLLAGQGIVARLGGDEFAILITGKDVLARAGAIAKNVLAFVQQPFDIAGRIANVGASIGVAVLGNDRIEAAELMRRADIAMYDAKDSGRNQWHQFNAELDGKRSERLTIAAELRDFIARGEFDIAYQPMVDALTHRVFGVEALARWPASSPQRVKPSRFIPIAEEHGLIDALGSLILRHACRDMAGREELRLAVNISPLQLNNPGFIANVKRIAADTGFDLARLEVELTETVLIKNPKRAKEVIRELQACCALVALDDFGTGYASVGYLRQFAFDKIKLDRSLTHGVAKDTALQQVVQGTALIARGLSAVVAAEGVELEEEAQLMHLAGCNLLQGYHFGEPQAIEGIDALLTNGADGATRVSA